MVFGNVKKGKNKRDIHSRFRADCSHKPNKEKGLWIAKFTTHNMEEIPEDLPKEIKNADDDVAEFYKHYPAHYIDFIEEYEIDEKLEGIISK